MRDEVAVGVAGAVTARCRAARRRRIAAAYNSEMYIGDGRRCVSVCLSVCVSVLEPSQPGVGQPVDVASLLPVVTQATD